MTVAKKKSTQEQIEILAPDRRFLRVTIEGETPLIVNRMGSKARETLRKQGEKKVKEKRPPRDPVAAYRDAFYVIDTADKARRYEAGENPDPKDIDGKRYLYGWPANTIKKGMQYVTKTIDGVSGEIVKCTVFVHGTHGDLIAMDAPEPPVMREDITRVGKWPNKQPDLRYRPEFPRWSLTFTISYDASLLTRDSVVNLLARSGMYSGCGERRASTEGGTWGQFRVTKVAEVAGR